MKKLENVSTNIWKVGFKSIAGEHTSTHQKFCNAKVSLGFKDKDLENIYLRVPVNLSDGSRLDGDNSGREHARDRECLGINNFHTSPCCRDGFCGFREMVTV